MMNALTKRTLGFLGGLALLASAAAPAAAAPEHGRTITLSGSGPSIVVGAPSHAGAMFDYTYTLSGTGTISSRTPVTFTYVEQGTDFSMSPPVSVINAATYTITKVHAHGPHGTFELHVIPSTYQISYAAGTGTPPCASGTFSYDVREGASVVGTFQPLVMPQGCVPTYSLQITVRQGSDADRHLDDD